jgi:hypothetical protein
LAGVSGETYRFCGRNGLTLFVKTSKREPAECLGTLGVGELAASGSHLLFTWKGSGM